MRASSKLNFIKMALRDGRIGTLTPSSKYVARKILREINLRGRFIVEYGAGDGAITKELLKILPADGRLVAVELNETFFAQLQTIKDDRLIAVRGDAKEISRNLKNFLPTVDVVVSTLPFALIKPADRAEIIQNSYDVLESAGLLLICQHWPIVFNLLRKNFKENTKLYFEPRNLWPYFIMTIRKK